LDNSRPFGRRGRKLWYDDYRPELCKLSSFKPGPLADLVASRDAKIDSIVISYYERLLGWSTQFNIGVNYSFFEIVGGDAQDADGDSLVDNAHAGQGRTFSAGITQNLWRRVSLSASLNHSNK